MVFLHIIFILLAQNLWPMEALVFAAVVICRIAPQISGWESGLSSLGLPFLW